jgi:hypothetical protein
MPEEQDDQERPCLHCMMVELINDFYAEYPSRDEGQETVDAIAKTVAEMTSSQSAITRQQIIEQMMRQIMEYDAEFRRDDAAGAIGSEARH